MKRYPNGWQRLDDRTRKTSARFRGPGGFYIEHCGHPTALWPWALYDPNGSIILARNGRAFRTLADAMAEGTRRAIAAAKGVA